MKPIKTLRGRLVIAILGIVTTCWLVLAAASYYQTRHEIDEVLDAQLAQTAGLLFDLVRSNEEIEEDEDGDHTPRLLRYQQTIAFQILDPHGRLLFGSRIAPKQVLSTQTNGLSTVWHEGISWRVYSLPSKATDRVIQVGERLDERKHISAEVVESVLKPIAWVLPLLGGLLLFSLGRILYPLRRLSQAIAERDVNNLSPINTESVLGELRPIIVQLNQLFERINTSLENEKRFTADAAHELRTPVAGIRLQAQVAQRTQNKEERQQTLAKVIQGCDRVTRVTEQLLVLARLDNSEAVSHADQVNCPELAREILADLSTMAHGKAIALSLDAGKVNNISSNEMLLRILLSNLVDNAIRYSYPQTEVVVRVGLTKDQTLWLEVTDQGPGIKPEDRHRIMERFYRGDQSQTGSGLGLSIVQRIATLLGGQIYLLDRNPPPGLTVRVKLPI